MKKIAATLNIQMPIMQLIHDALWGTKLPSQSFKEIENLLS
jgi:hypothetical protein